MTNGESPKPDSETVELRLANEERALLAQIKNLERIVWPWLIAIAMISSTTMVIGFARQIPNPDAMDYLRCGMIGLGLFGLTVIFWLGAWMLPVLRRKRDQLVFSLVFVAFLAPIVAISGIGSLHSIAGETSQSIIETEITDDIANAGRDAATYVDEMTVVLGGIEARRSQAGASQTAEGDGSGPTGQGGEGPVWRTYGEAERSYRRAADLIRDTLSASQVELTRLDSLIQDLRTLQARQDLASVERSARSKVLQGDAISAIRRLLALDPARSVAEAASIIGRGVPDQTGARTNSVARIAEIEAEMVVFASQLEAEGRRISTLAPVLPRQSSLSPTEQILVTMMRTPALSLSALLLDCAGLLALLWRALLYAALRAQERASKERLMPTGGRSRPQGGTGKTKPNRSRTANKPRTRNASQQTRRKRRH